MENGDFWKQKGNPNVKDLNFFRKKTADRKISCLIYTDDVSVPCIDIPQRTIRSKRLAASR